MNIINIENEGLKKVILSFQPLDEKNKKIEEYIALKAKTAKIDGFRPGKAPIEKVKAYYGAQAEQYVLNSFVRELENKIHEEHKEGFALPIDFDVLKKDDSLMKEHNIPEGVIAFKLTAFLNPEFELLNIEEIETEDYLPSVDEKEIEKKMQQIAKEAIFKKECETDHVIKEGDVVSFDIESIYAKKKQVKGFNAKQASLKIDLLDENFSFLFEKMIGCKKGDSIVFNQKFDQNFKNKNLASKDVNFNIKILNVLNEYKLEVSEELAKQLNFENIEAWKKSLKDEAYNHYHSFSNLCNRRRLLDVLAEKYQFAVPEKMVENEFNNIWNQLSEEEKTKDEDGKTEEEIKEECKKLSNRRVRLGFIMKKFAKELDIKVYQKDLDMEIMRESFRYGMQNGHDAINKVKKFYQENDQARDNLISMILEEKTVSTLLSKIKKKTVDISLVDLKKKVDEILPDFWKNFFVEEDKKQAEK